MMKIIRYKKSDAAMSKLVYADILDEDKYTITVKTSSGKTLKINKDEVI